MGFASKRSKTCSPWNSYIVALMLLSFIQVNLQLVVADDDQQAMMRGNYNMLKGGGRRCEELYVVKDGETLHSISDKCGDPFILEQNPHVQDSDDVFPGLLIKITKSRKFLF